jgi:hypothetical protein
MDRDQAVAELLALWGGTYERTEATRATKPHAKAACLVQQNGSLGELRRLNWPAIVTLIDESGAARFVVIASLDQGAARARERQVVRSAAPELTYHWFGEHLLLWRPGIPQPKDLIPGMRDAECSGSARHSRGSLAKTRRPIRRRSTTRHSRCECASSSGRTCWASTESSALDPGCNDRGPQRSGTPLLAAGH